MHFLKKKDPCTIYGAEVFISPLNLMTLAQVLNSILCLGLFVVERILSHKADVLVIYDLLCTSDKENSSGNQVCKILSENIVLGFLCEVDQNVTTYDQVAILGIRITENVSLFKGNR
jgi:hypothetical protein